MLSIKDNKAFLKLNPEYYKKKEIDEAVKAFGDVCKAEISGDNIILEPTSEIGPEKLGLEFCNYLISLK